MPLLPAEFTTEPAPADRRRIERRKVRLDLGHSSAGGGSRVVVLDLSETGMQIVTIADLRIGEAFPVQLPEAGLVEARVVWSRAPNFGCEFVPPVSKGAVSAALLTAPHERVIEDFPPSDSLSTRSARSDDPVWRLLAVLALSLTAIIVALLLSVMFSAPFSADQSL